MKLDITSQCEHWQFLEYGTGVCGKGLQDDEIVTTEVCELCPEYNGPDRGLGDKVANVVKKVTKGRIKPCSGCSKRRKLLNQITRNT